MPRWVSLAVFFRKWGQCSTYSDSPSIVFYKAEVPFKCAAAGHCKVCASMIQGCLRVLTFAPGSVCSCRCRRAPSHWQPPSLRGAPTPQQSREEREREASKEIGQHEKIQPRNTEIFQPLHLTCELQWREGTWVDATLEQQLSPKSLTAQAQIQHPNLCSPASRNSHLIENPEDSELQGAGILSPLSYTIFWSYFK